MLIHTLRIVATVGLLLAGSAGSLADTRVLGMHGAAQSMQQKGTLGSYRRRVGVQQRPVRHGLENHFGRRTGLLG